MSQREHLAFSWSMHRALAPQPSENFCWSPYSVSSALALAAEGAAGRTRSELLTALLGGDDTDLDGLRDMLVAASKVSSTVVRSGQEQPELAVANTLWAHRLFAVRESFLNSLVRWPTGAVRLAPFREDPENARQMINSDVQEITRELIKDLLPPGSVNDDTVAALVNALYLRSSWNKPFTESQTTHQDFRAPARSAPVPMMTTTDSLAYAELDGWQAVSLPAAGDVDAVVLLPDGDLGEAEPRCGPDEIQHLLAALQSRKVTLSLPRFECTGSAELTRPLGTLGVRQLFTWDADLSGLTPDRVEVSSAVHKSKLRVDEKGFEGAAATAMLIQVTSAFIDEEEPIEMRVDRPFLFLVRHRETGALYFLARITDPCQ